MKGGPGTSSTVMRPDDIMTYSYGLNNFSIICVSRVMIGSNGVFYGTNPLNYALPVLMIQVSIAVFVILFTKQLLKPLGQTTVVAQILGSIILGPSVLGRSTWFTRTFFPLRGFVVLDVIASFGVMLFFFLAGVNLDIWIVKKIDRKSIALGIFSVASPLVLTTTFSFFLRHHIDMDREIAHSLAAVSQAQSVLAFPAIAYFLAELKVTNSEFGRVALSASVIGGLCSFCVVTFSILVNRTPGDYLKVLSTVSTAILVAIVIVTFVRPIVLWMIRSIPEGEPLRESYVIALYLGILVTALASQAVGLNIYFGPLIFGIIIPPGPPVGFAMEEKLNLITSWMFIPAFFLKGGLVTNIFAIKLQTYLIVQSISLIGAFGKFLAAFLISIYCKIPTRDAIALGLVMNAQGVVEIGMFKLMEKNKAINNDAFVVMFIFMMILMAVITPVIKYIQNPSRRYLVYKRRTVMHSRPDSELRVLVCIHDNEHVPTTINFLETLNPTKRSPIFVYLFHLVELTARANPVLIPHKHTKTPSSNASPSQHIVNAFRSYEQNNHGLVMVYPYTAISHCMTMHDDVCMTALDERTSLIIVPFYTSFHNDGAVESYKKNIRIMNNNVLDNAPCSIAILVDRGLLKVSRPILASWSSYRVAVLFLGGADDQEALALGARMAKHPNINLTMIRLLENGNVSSGNEDQRRLDNEMVSEFRLRLTGNYHFMYIEEVVMDGTGTISVIRSMENNYELVMVGRRHDILSPLLTGLADWNEHSQLGAIGEVLATADFMGNTTVLVVQQQTNLVNDNNDNYLEKLGGQNVVEYDTEEMPIQRRAP